MIRSRARAGTADAPCFPPCFPPCCPPCKEALSDPAVVAHSKQWPWTPGQNLLLYEDPDHHFVINATVRKPGSNGAVHDHGHSWTLYGLVDGIERIAPMSEERTAA